jgi:hypothetical protein
MNHLTLFAKVMRYRVEVIASSPQLLEALFHAASRGLVIQERLTLQSAISLLVRPSPRLLSNNDV